MVALRGKVIFPKTFVSFDVGRAMSAAAVNYASESGNEIFIAAQKNALIDTPKKSDINKIGVVAKIRQIIKMPNGAMKVSIEAAYRAEIVKFTEIKNFFKVIVKRRDYIPSDAAETEAYFRMAKSAFLEYTLFDKRLGKDVLINISELTEADEFIDNVLSVMLFKESQCQKILDEDVTVKRLELFSKLLTSELEIARIEKQISSEVRKSIDKGQKEYYLREQLKVIHRELGDDDGEKEELLAEIKAKSCPKK